jgi:hypothetical protein
MPIHTPPTVFEIPFERRGAQGWVVESGQGCPGFSSRKDALSFASKAARACSALGDSAQISLQGGDGQWRTFEADLKPVATPILGV